MILLDETSTQFFEFGCYLGGHKNDANNSVVIKKHYNLGPFVSVIICYNLIRMGNLNLLNKSFLVFFTIDSILGITETFLMFDLNNTRYEVLYISIISFPLKAASCLLTLIVGGFWK